MTTYKPSENVYVGGLYWHEIIVHDISIYVVVEVNSVKNGKIAEINLYGDTNCFWVLFDQLLTKEIS